jgi:hypothetical protein
MLALRFGNWRFVICDFKPKVTCEKTPLPKGISPRGKRAFFNSEL